MTVTRHQRSYETNEAPQPSIGLSERKKLIETSQRHFSRDLTEEEARDWAKLMAELPIGLLRSAFEEWNRTGLYFPKMAQIRDLVDQAKLNATTKFRACEQAGCMDGWVRVFSGKTTGNEEHSMSVDPKVGAVKRCSCWYEWAGRSA